MASRGFRGHPLQVSETKDPAQGLQLLGRYLQERRAEGVGHVWLSDSALEQIQTLPMRARAVAAPPRGPQGDPPKGGGAGGRADDKAGKLAAVKARAEGCERCRGLGSLRDTMVFAVGDPDADLMFVGEAPGAEEEKQREPFVGPAGQLLTKIISTMGLRREEVYISNIVKFRPSTGRANQGTANRKPTAEEMAASVEYVRAEIEIVEPKLIVALGGTAMEGLLGIEGSVGRARGTVHDFDGRPAIVTYHPSFLLRSGAIGDKRKVWEDMLIAMEELGMPIGDKQRGYFLK